MTPDVAYQKLLIVNVAYIGVAGAADRQWVLVDTGVMGTVGKLKAAAEERFGERSRPAAIIQTHGHFDHVAGLKELSEEWDCPIYAHPLERPYLDGTASYPPPDPSVGGGMMAWLSGLYPRGPIDVSARLHDLPPDGSVPFLPGWQWVHAPGHTPGQIGLWRPADRLLIAADAFVTTNQESAYAAITQPPELQGPPMYYTQNWQEAKESVERLAALEAEIVITGHGPAMRGVEMRAALHVLARDFDKIAVPEHGRYLEQPADAEDGSAYVRKAS